MKTANSEMELAAETLYSFDDDKSNVANPNNIVNPTPSLVPDDPGKAYQKGFWDAARLHRSAKREDPFIDVLRNRVEQTRKNLVKKGRIEPANEKEKRWLR